MLAAEIAKIAEEENVVNVEVEDLDWVSRLSIELWFVILATSWLQLLIWHLIIWQVDYNFTFDYNF